MWHLRASLLALLAGIGIGLLSVKGCAPVDEDAPLDDTDPHDLMPNDGADAGFADAGARDDRGAVDEELPPGDLDDAGTADAGTADAGSEAGAVDAGTAEEPAFDAGTAEETGALGYYSEDRGEFFGETRCPSFALLCEDFEDGMPSTSTWTLAMTSDTVMGVDQGPPVDDNPLPRVARGSGALHITLPPEPSEAYLRNESLFPRDDDVIWGRLFFYVADPGPDAFVHWNIVEATGPSTTNANTQKLVRYGGVAVRDRANAFDFDNWLFNFEQRPRPSGFDELAIREDGQRIQRGTWHCMEWMFDAVSTEARVFRDGVEVEGARGATPLEGVEFTMPSFDGIHIGFAHYQFLDRGFDVWIDGVVLDDERIGCSN